VNDDCLVKDLSFRVHHTCCGWLISTGPLLLHTPTQHEGEGAARERGAEGGSGSCRVW